MKCAARRVIVVNHSAEQCRMYGENFLDWLEACFTYHLCRTYQTFRNAAKLQEFYDGTRDEIVGRVEGMTPEHFSVDDYRGRRESEDWEKQKEAIRDARFSVDAGLRRAGFPRGLWDTLEPEADKGFRYPREEAVAQQRKIYYEEYGREATLLFTGGELLWLAEREASTGRVKFSPKVILEKVYAPYEKAARRYLGRFLSGREAADRKNAEELRMMMRWMEDVCNIDIGNIGDAERREERAREAARRGTVNVPAEELAKYEAILADVKKGKVIY